MRLAICCLLLSSCITSCKQPGIPYMTGTLTEVFSQAKKTHKNVFILIGNSQCGHCGYFAQQLEQQARTVRMLRDGYICYKVDVLNPAERDIARVTACPSFPFPYFFDQQGNLLAFGFPDTKNYNISQLREIGVDQYRFRELFRLPLSLEDYKQWVSLNLKATLLLQSGGGSPEMLDQAAQLVTRSRQMAAHPYNLYLDSIITTRLGTTPWVSNSRIVLPWFTHTDTLLYSAMPGLVADTMEKASTLAFLQPRVDCGRVKQGADVEFSFTFRNTGAKELLIASADHPCSCIELHWPGYPIKPGATANITGVFHAREKGSFLKNIYVHTLSGQNSMKIISLTGVVG